MAAFIANDDLLKGRYEKARQAFLDVEKTLPKGAAPFAVRYGLAFSYLYEGQVDPAIAALKTYLGEYKDSGAAQGFPEVFIWNSIARINLENGRLDAAMQAYEKGYESVPGSSLPEDQKQVWLGRLMHGRCRTLAKMGKHEEAWTEAEKIKKMIDEGGEPAKQYVPGLALPGRLSEARGPRLTRRPSRSSSRRTPTTRSSSCCSPVPSRRRAPRTNAQKTYRKVVDSQQNGLERALAYPEAKKKL